MSDLYYIWGWRTRRPKTDNYFTPWPQGFIARDSHPGNNDGALQVTLRNTSTSGFEWNYYGAAGTDFFTKFDYTNPETIDGMGYFDWGNANSPSTSMSIASPPSTHAVYLRNPFLGDGVTRRPNLNLYNTNYLANGYPNQPATADQIASPTWVMAKIEHSADNEITEPTTQDEIGGEITYYFCVLDRTVDPAVPKVLGAFKGPKGYIGSRYSFTRVQGVFGPTKTTESWLYESEFNNGFQHPILNTILKNHQNGVVGINGWWNPVGDQEDAFFYTNKTSSGSSPIDDTKGLPELISFLDMGAYSWDPASTAGSGPNSTSVPGRFVPGPPSTSDVAESVGVAAEDIELFKTVTFVKTAGKAVLDNTRKDKIQSLISEPGLSVVEKREKRSAVLKLLFSQDVGLTKMVIPKEALGLPVQFTKANAVVVKAGEPPIDLSTLADDEGFYSVLSDGETFKVSTTNTTLTFTRTDDGLNELYGVTATTWTDIIINSDDVTGTFTSELNTGTLLPDDKIGIDGRDFIIGSVADGGTSGSGADPYVYPINSSVPVKLPNRCATYRMFEQGDNYINVEVGRATKDHQERMIEYAEKLTQVTHNIVCDGYFYHKAFISAEGHTLLVDYTDKKVKCNSDDLSFFKIKQSKKKFSCGEFGDDSHCMTVAWETKEGKKIHTEIMFFPNPHIENGINVIPETTIDSTGLIVTNYKPKLMAIPSISTEKYGKLWKRLKNTNNKFQYKSIKGKNEKWHKH